jgi:hypothetical protein
MLDKRELTFFLVIIGLLIGPSTIIYFTQNQNSRIISGELTVINVVFSGSNSINVTVINTGTETVTINQVRINQATISTANWTLNSNKAAIIPETVDYVEITSSWTAGSKYNIMFFASDETILGSYTKTA